MEIILTETQKLYSDIPTRLDLLRELNKRHALVDNEELQEQLKWLERGLEGEEILLEYLERHGEQHWKILKNVWVKYYDIFECDLLLLTYNGFYMFEVKNYSGTFELKNNIGSINGNESSKHPITQGQNLVINLNKILQESSSHLRVTGAVAFVGPDNIVDIYDDVQDISVVRRNELRNFIWRIGNEDRYSSSQPINHNQILNALGNYEIAPPHLPEKDIPQEVYGKVHGGICCCNCGSFDIEITKPYIICDCGMHEPRDEAIVRTICEYGLIHYDEDLTTTKLADFFNGDVSRKNIQNILKTYFEKIGTYKNARYKNNSLSFNEIYDQFGFTELKVFKFSGVVNNQLKY